MLVGERMTYPVITISPDLSINEALNLMKREHIRRLPVMKDSKLVGIVTEQDLLYASPSPATTLSVWEMNYLLSKVTVKEVMTKEIITVPENTPIEEAARMMVDNKIGGLPVMRDDVMVGIITETDLFKVLLELMGARESGIRASVFLVNKPGQLARLAQAIADKGGNIISIANFLGDDPTNRQLNFKVSGLSEEELRAIIEPLVIRIKYIQCC